MPTSSQLHTPILPMSVLRPIDELEYLVDRSPAMPLTHHKMVDEDSFCRLTGECRKNLLENATDQASTQKSIEALDRLEELLKGSKIMPLTQQRLVDEDAFYQLTLKLKNSLGEHPGLKGAAAYHSPTVTHAVAAPHLPRLRRKETLLLIVDVQEKLMPVIHESERVEANCAVLAKAARELHLPIVITEQYPEKLGPTANAVREAAGFPTAISKLRFSACTPQTLAALESSGRKTVLLCGVEAHVCVLQTALDLREHGYQVFAARDALSSRTPENAEIGWQRMQQAGVLPTSTESALFELLEEAGTPEFKAILPLIK